MSKVALVTGAGSGIGQAAAVALSRDGFALALCGRRRANLEETASALSGEYLIVPTDIGDPDAVAALFAAVTARFGRLDLLFNNAGLFTPSASLEDISFDQWQAALGVNVTGAFLCTQQAMKMMKAQTPRGGRIINNGSVSASTPRLHSAAYTATKHALTGLTKATALDGRAFDIACGQIDIGNAVSDMTEKMEAGVLQADGNTIREARMDLGDAVRAIVYMASLPLSANVLFMTVMATKMPLVGRG